MLFKKGSDSVFVFATPPLTLPRLGWPPSRAHANELDRLSAANITTNPPPSHIAIGRLQDVINQCIQVISRDDVSLDRAVPLLVRPSTPSKALLFQTAANAK